MSPAGHGSDDGGFSQEVGTQTAKAVVLIVVAVLIAVLLLHREGSTSPGARTSTSISAPATTTTTPGATTTTTVAPSIPPSQVKLRVLNGTTNTAGTIAGQYASKLKASPGYDTLTPDNTTSAVTSSVIYAVTSEYQSEGVSLASDLGLPASAVTVNVPSNAPIRSTEKADADLILVVGPDLAAKLPGGGSSGSSSSSTTATTSGT